MCLKLVGSYSVGEALLRKVEHKFPQNTWRAVKLIGIFLFLDPCSLVTRNYMWQNGRGNWQKVHSTLKLMYWLLLVQNILKTDHQACCSQEKINSSAHDILEEKKLNESDPWKNLHRAWRVEWWSRHTIFKLAQSDTSFSGQFIWSKSNFSGKALLWSMMQFWCN